MNWKPLATQTHRALPALQHLRHPLTNPQPSHHRARLPKQQGYEVAVLAQEAESRVDGLTPLALEGDEDRSARELQ